MGARPVVPIAEASAPQPRHLPLLALVVILAVGAGVAGGFAIGLYKSRQYGSGAGSPATATTAPAEQTAQTPRQEQLPATIASEKSPAPKNTATAENATAERTAPDSRPETRDDEVLAPVEARERDREKRDREEREREDRIARAEERESRRQQRKERRRAREREETEPVDINEQIERGAREVNRIREIFEGQRP